MDTMINKIVCLSLLGLLIVIGSGCRRSSGSGSSNFSHNFNSEKKEDLIVAEKMYNSVCQELERLNFKEVKSTSNPELKSSIYEGEYDGFPLTVDIHHLLDTSTENPEFYYRVSFEKTTATNELNKASKDLRMLMKEWSSVN